MLVRRPRTLTLRVSSALWLSGALFGAVGGLGKADAMEPSVHALLRQTYNRGMHTINHELLKSGEEMVTRVCFLARQRGRIRLTQLSKLAPCSLV